jgi:hypothetical protein
MQPNDDRILYEGRSARTRHICVTPTWCVVDGNRYRVSDMDLLGVSRGRRDMARPGKVARTVLLVGGLVAMPVAIAGGWTRDVWVAVAVALVGTAALTALPTVLGRVLRRPYEIWAEYHGAPVLLFSTDDAEQYGQVARALVRAREAWP